MKKGKQFKVKIFKLKTLFHSGFISYTIGFIILSLISFSSIIVNMVYYLTKNASKIEFIVGTVVAVVSFVVSLFGTARSIISVNYNYFHKQFLNDEKYKDEIIKSVTAEQNVNSDYRDNNYVWNNYKGQWYLYSKEVDDALIKRSNRLLLNVTSKKQPIGTEQREALYKLVCEKIAAGRNIFNSNLVRLRTDFFITKVLSDKNNIDEINKQINGTDENTNGEEAELKRFNDLYLVDVEKTDYFSNMTTNDQIYSQLFKFNYSSVYCGKDMSVDKFNSLYNLSQSPAANIIGISTIAITKDGCLIINKQNNNNDVNNECFVPSGSGSSDFDDLKACLKIDKESGEGGKIYQLRQKIKSYGNIKDQIINYRNKVLKYKCNENALTQLSGNSENKDGVSDKKNVFNELITKYLKLLRDKKDVHAIKKYCSNMKKYTCDFNKFITYGMVRELIEESHFSEKNKNIDTIKKFMKNTYVCGFIRLLDRGGKPDFFGVTLLDFDVAEAEILFNKGRTQYAQIEISKRCALTDFNEVCAQKYVPIKSLVGFKDIETFRKYLSKDDGKKDKTKISLQLYYLFNRLQELFNDPIILNEIKDNTELNYFDFLGKYFNDLRSKNEIK